MFILCESRSSFSPEFRTRHHRVARLTVEQFLIERVSVGPENDGVEVADTTCTEEEREMGKGKK